MTKAPTPTEKSKKQCDNTKVFYNFLNVCPFDYTAFAVSGKVGIP